MRKKVISIFMIAVLSTMVLSGCSSQEKSGTDKGSKETKGSEAVVTEAVDAEVADTEVEKHFEYSMAVHNFGPWDENPEMLVRWEEEYNADFNLVYVETAQAGDQINLMVASGDIPDVIQQVDMNKYYKDGIIGGWSEEFFREHAPNLSKYIDETDPSAWQIAKFDGELMYSIPCFRLYDTIASPVVWRTDWLKNVGIEGIPRTLEEFEDAFYKFAKNDPDANGKNDTYGISETGIRPIYGAFGSYRGKWLLDENEQVVYGDVKPEMKQALELLSKWYADGVIDPEFITGENEGGYWAITHKFLNNKIGFTNMGLFYHWLPDMSQEENGTAIGDMTVQWKSSGNTGTYAMGYAPEGPDGHKGTDRADFRKLRTVFSVDLVNDEERFGRLLEIIDDMNSSTVERSVEVNRGTLGVYSDIVDFKGSQAYVAIGEAKAASALNAFNGAKGAANTFAFIEEGGNLDYQKVAYAQQFVWANEEFKDKNDGYVSVIFKTPESRAKYGAELDKILNEGYINIITGDKPLSYFDEMVATWYANGGEQITKEANEIYAKEHK
jgi:putative aldouronate transport system substrate-binding protein